MTLEEQKLFIVDGVEYRTGYIDSKDRKIVYRWVKHVSPDMKVPMVLLLEKVKGKWPEIQIVNTREQLNEKGKKIRCPICTLEEFIKDGRKRGPGRPKKSTPDETGGSSGMAKSSSDSKTAS